MAAILQALEVKEHRPWILADTADAITGGSSGRSAYILQALLPHANAFCAPILLQVVDPETVDRAAAGETFFHIGDQRVPVQASRVRTAEGRYSPRGRSYRGIETSMKGAAVIETGKLQIVAAREPTLGVMDPAFYECVGLNPESALAVQVKSLTGWMSGYEGCADQGLYVDGPGATSLRFTALPFLPPNDRIYPIVDPDPLPLQVWTSEAKPLRSLKQPGSPNGGGRS
jgi:microcystin degradation protein MlrC